MELARKGSRHLPQPPEGDGWVAGHREIRSCGDVLTVHLLSKEGRVSDAAYTGEGCALSLASAELLCGHLAGKELREAEEFLRASRSALDPASGNREILESRGLEALTVIREYPARKGCVLLAFDAALEALSATGKADHR